MKKRNFKIIKSSIFAVIISFALLFCAVLFAMPTSQGKPVVSHAFYGDSNALVEELQNNQDALPVRYDLSKKYPVLAENQVSSNLCWAYASTKALETAYMVQSGEYKNYSEVGTAVVAHNHRSPESQAFDITGTFEKFVLVAQNYGLVYESDFSNDKMLDIDAGGENADNYAYIERFADKISEDEALPINLSSSSIFTSQMSMEEKQATIKKFLVNFGGLFAGIRAGTIYDSHQDIYGTYAEGDLTESTNNGKYFSENHAVCIIGWDDSFGWLALNSWGVETKVFEKFYIPFSYQFVYGTLAGFDCAETEPIKLVSSEANTAIKTGYEIIPNMFNYGEEVLLTFSVSDEIYSDLYLNIYSGQENVTGKFTSTFSDADKTVTIRANGSVSGAYSAKFFVEGELISVKEIFVHTGSEIAYTKIINNLDQKSAQYSFFGSHESQRLSETYYLSAYVYDFDVYKSDLFSGKLNISFKDFYVTSTEGGEIQREKLYGTSYISPKETNDLRSRYQFNFSNFASTNIDAHGKMIELTMVISGDTGASTSYNLKFIISDSRSDNTTNSTKAYSIEYDTDGGKNDPRNIDRYPNFVNEANMTEFEIFAPTKDGYDFLGWYLSPDCEEGTQLDPQKITSSQSGDITLYAKWANSDTEYFSGEIAVKEITDYYGESKQVSDPIIYGDSLTFVYNFNATTALTGNVFSVKYYYYLNGTLICEDVGNRDQSQEFVSVKMTGLDARQNNSLVVVVSVVISRQFSVVKESDPFVFDIAQKTISAEFEETQVTYDGQAHSPKVTFDGVYDKDAADLGVNFNLAAQKNANEQGYNFQIQSLTNPNYVLSGSASCNFVILKCEVKPQWQNLTPTYSGTMQHPIAKLVLGSGAECYDPITANIDIQVDGKWVDGATNAGSYVAKVVGIVGDINGNYKTEADGEAQFRILPAKIRVEIENVRERLQTAKQYRKVPSYQVFGQIFGDDDLGLKIVSDGLIADESGEYKITAKHTNTNYELEVSEATYTLVGTYRVFYTLPDGSTYEEIVDDGENPKGVPQDVFKAPLFCTLTYSESLTYTGTDMFVTVTVQSYRWLVAVILVVAVIIIIYLAVTHKRRKNKIR